MILISQIFEAAKICWSNLLWNPIFFLTQIILISFYANKEAATSSSILQQQSMLFFPRKLSTELNKTEQSLINFVRSINMKLFATVSKRDCLEQNWNWHSSLGQSKVTFFPWLFFSFSRIISDFLKSFSRHFLFYLCNRSFHVCSKYCCLMMSCILVIPWIFNKRSMMIYINIRYAYRLTRA